MIVVPYGGIGPGASVLCGQRRATVGALVNRGGRLHALTVAHVFCAGRNFHASFGNSSGVGQVVACNPLRRLCVHDSDAALVLLNTEVALTPDHPLVGPLRGHLTKISVGLPVVFSGGAGVIRGRIVREAWIGRIRYPWGGRKLQNQIVIEVESSILPHRGDSGGLWVTSAGIAVGIQVAMTNRFAIVSPLGPLLSAWDACLLRSRTVSMLPYSDVDEQQNS